MQAEPWLSSRSGRQRGDCGRGDLARCATHSDLGHQRAEEQERRATSALLAVMSAVREFGRAILGPLGAPAGQYETYIEVPFADGDRNVYPDGLIRTRRGERTWTALVEVKTGW
jgi:hypothetical protein